MQTKSEFRYFIERLGILSSNAVWGSHIHCLARRRARPIEASTMSEKNSERTQGWKHRVSRFWNPIAAVCAAIAAIGVALQFGTGRTNLVDLYKDIFDHGTLRLSDVRVIDDRLAIREFGRTWLGEGFEHDRFEMNATPIIDIRVRNIGATSIQLTRLEFSVRTTADKSFKDVLINCMGDPASWQYNVVFPRTQTIQQVEVPIAQVIRPNGSDRFVVRVAHREERAAMPGREKVGDAAPSQLSVWPGARLPSDATHEFTATLHYNGTEKLELGRHSIRISTICSSPVREKANEIRHVAE